MLTGWLTALAALAGGLALGITDEEYARFPRLYHLDDYSGCLAKSEGLYCVGSFHIRAPRHPDRTYELMQEYSRDPFHFNRTQVHRGYCVSARCPQLAAQRNATLRFEECAALWGRRRQMRLELASLSYCKSHAQEFTRQRTPEPYDAAQRALLYVLAALCLANAIGSGYDWLARDGTKKKEALVVWSVRSNWRRLTATYEDGDPRLCALSPVQGLRVILMLIIIGTHAGCIHDMLYLYNPRYVETVARHPVFMIFMNGTSVVMVFVMVSSFLLAYNLLLLTRRVELRVSMLLPCVLKRVARITPVYLLVVAWAATLWPRARDGPMWPTLVLPEARVCRDKFWAHAFFLNNLLRPDDHCLVQTWFLATDMQLYVVACLLTLWLARRRLAALPVLAALTAASCLLNGALAYYFQWTSLLYHVYPSTMHTMYHGVESFYLMYTSPWGSLPACLVGLFLAHLHFEFQERGIKPATYRLFRWVYQVAPLLIVGWILAGNWVRDITDPTFTAFYLALERPVLSLLGAILLLGLFNKIPGLYLNVLGWTGWYAMGRMSLSVLMLHWIVNTCIAAARPQPIATSFPDVVVDSVATASLTYIAAIPLTIMVEMPISRLINLLLFKRYEKYSRGIKSQDPASSEISQSQDKICSDVTSPCDKEIVNNDSSESKKITDSQQKASCEMIKPKVEPISSINESNGPQELISSKNNAEDDKSIDTGLSLLTKIGETTSEETAEQAIRESSSFQKEIRDDGASVPQEGIIEHACREDLTSHDQCTFGEVIDRGETIDCDAVEAQEGDTIEHMNSDNTSEMSQTTNESFNFQENDEDQKIVVLQKESIGCDSDMIPKEIINEILRPADNVNLNSEVIAAQVEANDSDGHRQGDLNEMIGSQEEAESDEQVAKEDGLFRTLIVTMRRTLKVM